MVPAAKNLHIGAARQGGLHTYQDVSFANSRDSYRLNLKMLFSI
jgi:hypothetical protein